MVSNAAQARLTARSRSPGLVVEDAAGGEQVERDPGPGEVPQRTGVEVGDPETAVRLGDHEPLLGQLADRLAYGRPADLQVGGERELGELVPRPQRTDDDAPPDLGEHRLPPRHRRRRCQRRTQVLLVAAHHHHGHGDTLARRLSDNHGVPERQVAPP